MLQNDVAPPLLGPVRSLSNQRVAWSVFGWGLLVTTLAIGGLLTLLPTQLLPLPIALATSALLAGYALVPSLRHYAQQLEMSTLTLFNVWRIPAAWPSSGMVTRGCCRNSLCATPPGAI